MSEQRNHKSSPSYATPSKSREEIAEHIANGHPSPVRYVGLVPVTINGHVYYKDATPIHLMREGQSRVN